MKKLIANIILWEGWFLVFVLLMVALFVVFFWILALTDSLLMACAVYAGMFASPFFFHWLCRKWMCFVTWCEQQRGDSPGKKA